MTSWEKRHKVVPAVFLILQRDDKVLLLRRFNTGYNDGNYSLPAGHLEGQESMLNAVIREAKEEVDIDLQPEQLEFVHVLHRAAQEAAYERIDLYFRVRNFVGEPKNAEPDKCDELLWASYGALPKNMVSEVRLAIERLRDGVFYSDLDL